MESAAIEMCDKIRSERGQSTHAEMILIARQVALSDFIDDIEGVFGEAGRPESEGN